MTLHPQNAETSGAAPFDDSGFLNPEAGSEPADADYTDANAGDLNESSNNLEKAIANVPQTSDNDDSAKAAERQRRMMSRVPQ